MARTKENLLDKAIKAASREMGLPVDDWRVERLANLQVLLRIAQSKWANIIAHEKTASNSAEIISLLDAITEAKRVVLPSGARGSIIPNVRIQPVEGVEGYYQCQKCGHGNHLPAGSYTPLQDTPKSGAPAAPTPPSAPTPEQPQQPADAPVVVEAVREPIRSRGEYVGPSGAVEVLPFKRLRPNDWHRNLDPADAGAPEMPMPVLR
jgi:hypothetical protein